jgi:phenylalanyl-tRNA synthetase beta subunit
MIQKEFMIVPAKIENMIDGRSAFLTCDDKEVGIIGEMHPEYLKNSNIKQPVSCFVLNLDKIFKF